MATTKKPTQTQTKPRPNQAMDQPHHGHDERAVAKRPPREIVPAELAEMMKADAGAGIEEANTDAFAMPFIRILQDLSPQVKSKMDGYIEGAKPGMIFNTATKELNDSKELWVVPCYFQQAFIEWKSRDEGGGFVAAHPPGTPLANPANHVRDGAKMLLKNGNELMDTRQHFVLVLNEEGTGAEPALLAFTSAGIKDSRLWMSRIQKANAQGFASFAYKYRLEVVERANDQGQWFAFEVKEAEMLTSPRLYAEARAFWHAMKQGSAKVNYNELQTAGQEELKTVGKGSTRFRDPVPGDLDDNDV